jgi:acyl-coenzyme A synthetase/AMP-(fatty) acid ligase
VLNAVPGVARSAVVGRPAVGGEEIVAFVQISPGSTLGTAEIAACAAKELAPYKRPTAILVLPMLPASPTGKILKSELSAMAATTRVSA